MIRQALSIVVMSSVFVSCAAFTVKDIGGGKYYVEGILPNDAIRRAQEFCKKQNKEVADERIEAAAAAGYNPSLLFTCD
mgnify:FL=1